MGDKTLDELYSKLKKACLSNVIERVTEECIDDDKNEVDIVRLKKELNSFRQREIDEPGTKKKTEGNLTYYLLVRKLESFAAEHLRKYVINVKEDVISLDEFSKAVKSIDIDTPLPNIAPDLPTKVIITKDKDLSGKKDNIQLTTGDSIKKRFQSSLVLKKAKDGTLYEARSRICYKLSSDNHYVAVGKIDNEGNKHKLTASDIEQVKADGYPYIDESGAEIDEVEEEKNENEDAEEDNENKNISKDKEEEEEGEEEIPKKKGGKKKINKKEVQENKETDEEEEKPKQKKKTKKGSEKEPKKKSKKNKKGEEVDD